jgi:hypothetical protein
MRPEAPLRLKIKAAIFPAIYRARALFVRVSA